MAKCIFVLNGPNLNLLGQRKPEIYGHATLFEIQEMCEAMARAQNFSLCFHQSNHEGQLIDWVQEACSQAQALLINPAAFGHTSIALYDALQIFSGPVVEVHLSNIYKRESFRHQTYSSRVSDAVISGCGPLGYQLGLEYLISCLK